MQKYANRVNLKRRKHASTLANVGVDAAENGRFFSSAETVRFAAPGSAARQRLRRDGGARLKYHNVLLV